MASGLSSTLIGVGIERVDAYRCRAVGRPDPPTAGQILSARSHTSGSGLLYFEAEWERINATGGRRVLSIFLRGATTDLDDFPGLTAIPAMFDGVGDVGKIDIWQSGGPIASFGSQRGTSVIGNGKLYRVWVDCASRKVWITNEANPQQSAEFRPDLGNGELWTFSEAGDIRFGVSPTYGSSVPDTNELRVRTRYQDLICPPGYGARPWDSRSVTLVEDVSGVANGTTVRWAWFDEPRPDLMTIAPTTTGTATVTSGQVSATVSTSLDPGGIGSLLLSNTDGTVIQCRSHYAPAAVS